MSQTACWGTNKLERCGWVSFGYGSIHDTDRYWVSLEAAKALARIDYGPINLNAHEWYGREEEYKQLCPRLRLAFSAWHLDVPGDIEETHRWWEEIEKEMGKHGLGDLDGDFSKLRELFPEDFEIYDRCKMMEYRSDEARQGYMDVCHDETVLNVCTEDHRHANGCFNFRDFNCEEEILLTGNDDTDALIIAKAILKEHLRVMGPNIMAGIGIDDYVPPTIDITDVNPFDPENSTTMFVEKIAIEGTTFKAHLYEYNKFGYYIYTFDRSDAKPNWDLINERKARNEERKKQKESLGELEMLEWGLTWEEASNHPKCRYKYNENFNADIFDPEVFSLHKKFGHYRFGCPEDTPQGSWYIFGGPLVRKEFVSSHGRSTGGHWYAPSRNYQCRPSDWYVMGGTLGAPEYDHGPNKDYWQNPALP
jgi:hypothetical protein